MVFGQIIFLSDTVHVSSDGTGSRSPRIALLEGNRPVVYWGKTGNNPTLYLSIWTDGSFGSQIALNTNGIEPDLWSGGLGPQIAAQGNTIFLIFETYGQGIYCIKSNDGGQSFDNPVGVYDAPQGRVATLPSIAIDPNNNPVVSFITTDFSEQNAQHEITKSTDGGTTFPPTIIASSAASGDEVCECCPSSIGIVSEDEMYLAFRNNENNTRDIWVSKSTDSGASFPEAVDIDTTDWLAFVCPQSGPDILLSGDSIFSVFFNGETGSNIFFSSMNKNTMQAGDQFQLPALNGSNNSQNFPSIAGNGDTLGIVWQENGANNNEIMMTWSVNGSADLLNNYIVVDDNLSSQKQPDIIFKDGLFHIVYDDLGSAKVIYRIASFEDLSNAIEVQNSGFMVRINPNPVSEKAIVSFENQKMEKITASLINVNGQLVNEFITSESTIEFDCKALDAGVYFLKIQKGKQHTIEQIIIN